MPAPSMMPPAATTAAANATAAGHHVGSSAVTLTSTPTAMVTPTTTLPAGASPCATGTTSLSTFLSGAGEPAVPPAAGTAARCLPDHSPKGCRVRTG